jgi:hypothetical protein
LFTTRWRSNQVSGISACGGEYRSALGSTESLLSGLLDLSRLVRVA